MRIFDVTIRIGLANANRIITVKIEEEENEELGQLSENEIQEIIWNKVQEYIEYSYVEKENVNDN